MSVYSQKRTFSPTGKEPSRPCPRRQTVLLHPPQGRSAIGPSQSALNRICRLGLACAADLDEPVQAAAHARLKRLDPINPTYIDEEEGYAFYLAGRYDESIAAFERSMPNQFHEAHACLAAAYGQVGDKRSARQAWERCVALRPGYTLESFADEAGFEKAADMEHWLDGLRKAGLEE